MTESANPLARLDQATRLLAQARTVDEVKLIRDQAEAMRMYARERDLGLQAQNHAAEIKIRAERRLGELLAVMPMQDGGDAMKARSHAVTEVPPTLAEMGFSKMESSRWQRIAELPEPKFEEHIAEAKAQQREITTAAVERLAAEHRAEQDTAIADRILSTGMALDPGTEHRYRQAQLRTTFARALSKADDLLALRPSAVVPVLEPRDLEAGRRFIQRFGTWLQEFELASSSRLRVVEDE